MPPVHFLSACNCANFAGRPNCLLNFLIGLEQRAQAAKLIQQMSRQVHRAFAATPVRKKIASNSASERLAGPCSSNLSRGRSAAGQSRILIAPSLSVGAAVP
jgi:hypothetical protein